MKLFDSNDHNLERHTFPQSLARAIVVPILNYVIPERRIKKMVAKLSTAGEEAIKRSGSTHAMESFYAGRQESVSLGKRAKEYLTHYVLSATMGTRNRLRIVESLLKEEIRERSQAGATIHATALGGGTCRSFANLFESISQDDTETNLFVTNIDLDATAHVRGRELMAGKPYEKQFSWRELNFFSATDVVAPRSVDIIEMIGVLDYMADEQALAILAVAHSLLASDGILITANVRPNSEAPFYRKTGWPVFTYRTPRQLGELLICAGFDSSHVELFTEPVGLHTVARARR